MKAFGTFDTRSNRKDLWTILDRLSLGVSIQAGNDRRKRVILDLFQSVWGRGNPGSSQLATGEFTTDHAYRMIAILCSQFQLDIERVTIALENTIRRLR